MESIDPRSAAPFLQYTSSHSVSSVVLSTARKHAKDMSLLQQLVYNLNRRRTVHQGVGRERGQLAQTAIALRNDFDGVRNGELVESRE
jgi:hypothetical protein